MSDLLVRDQSWPWAIPRRCTIRIRAPPAPHDLISERGERKKERKKKNPPKGSTAKATDQHRGRVDRAVEREVRRQEIERGKAPAGGRTCDSESRGRPGGGTERRGGHHAMTNLSCSFSPHTASRTETGIGCARRTAREGGDPMAA